MSDIEAWEDDVLRRYADSSEPSEDLADRKFRDYDAGLRPCVKEFYGKNHRYQTVDFVRGKHQEFLGLERRRMGIWSAMEYLNQLVDDSDPDLDLPQIEHLLQTAEAIRADGKPDWFILTGLVHDLGKILCLWGEPQWAVVGDTFPVGCSFSSRIIYHEAFRDNADWDHPTYSSKNGIYEPNCGLDNVILSWGHDEYMYHVAKPYLPPEGLAMIRYHSCYPVHAEHAYGHLLTESDRETLAWVREFNRYDLYTKREERMNVSQLRPFYEELIAKYFPAEIAW